MEEFEKIDWLPNVEDIIDDKFISEERLETESSMYQIVNGKFQDPFMDIRPLEKNKQGASQSTVKTLKVEPKKLKNRGKKKKKKKN